MTKPPALPPLGLAGMRGAVRREARRVCRELWRWRHAPRRASMPGHSKHHALTSLPPDHADQHLTRMLNGHFLRIATHLYKICNQANVL